MKKSSNSITARKKALLGGIGVLASIFFPAVARCCLGQVPGWVAARGGWVWCGGGVGWGGSQLKRRSRLWMGLPGLEEVVDLLVSVVRLIPLSMALLFLLSDEGGLEFCFWSAASSRSVSSMRGCGGCESSIRKLRMSHEVWMEV